MELNATIRDVRDKLESVRRDRSPSGGSFNSGHRGGGGGDGGSGTHPARPRSPLGGAVRFASDLAVELTRIRPRPRCRTSDASQPFISGTQTSDSRHSFEPLVVSPLQSNSPTSSCATSPSTSFNKGHPSANVGATDADAAGPSTVAEADQQDSI